MSAGADTFDDDRFGRIDQTARDLERALDNPDWQDVLRVCVEAAGDAPVYDLVHVLAQNLVLYRSREEFPRVPAGWAIHLACYALRLVDADDELGWVTETAYLLLSRAQEHVLPASEPRDGTEALREVVRVLGTVGPEDEAGAWCRALAARITARLSASPGGDHE